MPKKLKEIPKFKSEDDEREFWAKNDSSEYVDWENADSKILGKLKSSSRLNLVKRDH